MRAIGQCGVLDWATPASGGKGRPTAGVQVRDRCRVCCGGLKPTLRSLVGANLTDDLITEAPSGSKQTACCLKPIRDIRRSRQREVMKNANRLDPEAEGRLARKQFSTAFMSDTKWRKLLTAVRDSDLGLREMVVKFIDVDEPRTMRFPPDLSCPRAYMDTIEFGPTALRAIEWMEFRANLETILRPIGQFAMETYNGSTRIVGYAA